MQKLMRRLERACGFHCNPHKLRHTFATRCADTDNDVPLFQLQEALGHTSLDMVRRYGWTRCCVCPCLTARSLDGTLPPRWDGPPREVGGRTPTITRLVGLAPTPSDDRSSDVDDADSSAAGLVVAELRGGRSRWSHAAGMRPSGPRL
jgi:hypothetical protein